MSSAPTQPVEKSFMSEIAAFRELYGGPLTPPIVSPEQKAAMAHNMRVNLHRYGDPMGYMFDYEDEASSEDE